MAHTEALRGANSTVHAGLGMEVLYVRPNFLPTSGKEAIAERGHHVVSCAKSADALQLIRDYSFDAMVIENEDEDLEVIDFTIEVNRIRPNLPVFLTSDWGSDLPIGVEDVLTGAFAT